ncbi:MAG: M28 family peptidase [Bacteroidetes bacterium]|nr:M28 family peptidase [Bacteroidota bacterium]MBL6943389.1 M28 family peptidase [Bacteroidales bacterium]
MGQNRTSDKKPPQKERITPPPFNADSAYKFVEEQVEFGPRVPGSEAHNQCASWLAGKLTSYGAKITVQNFKTRTYDGVTRNGKNIIASFNHKTEKRILLMAHWDSRPFADHDENLEMHNTPIDGANDGASGVGVLLEMARQFQQTPPKVGVDIIFFDLEDWGPPHEMQITYDEENWGLGSQYWSKNPHKYAYSAAFGILLDMVGAKNAEFRREYHSDREARFVVDLVWNTAADMGYRNVFIDEPGGAITDDHYFVNKYAKIPSIDIIHLDPNSKNQSFFDHWHTINDKMEFIDKESLQIVGDVLMNVVYNE